MASETGPELTPLPTSNDNAKASSSAFDAIAPYLRPGRENVTLIYILFLAGLIPAFGVVPIIVGFVMALLNRSEAKGVWVSHYEYQFRTAAIGLLFVAISAVLVIVLIGLIGLLLTAIWWIVRGVRGLQAAAHEQPIPDPKTWSW